MTEPTICPCTSSVKKETFFFFIMVIDLLDGGISFIFSLISLCIYCGPKNFHSGFFRCWAITRMIFQIIILSLLGILLIAILVMSDPSKISTHFTNKALAISVVILISLFFCWNLYLSIQYNNAIVEYQNNKEGLEDEIVTDDKKVELNNPPEAENNPQTEEEEKKDIEN